MKEVLWHLTIDDPCYTCFSNECIASLNKVLLSLKKGKSQEGEKNKNKNKNKVTAFRPYAVAQDPRNGPPVVAFP